VSWLSEAVKNGQPSMYLFDGGYATFNQNGAINGWHYYIQDYMGNNRMVVNKNGTKEQITHYYPYGGVIGDISTNENVQKYKFEGKELDRTFGLDNYDIHARQYFAMMPTWDRIDPLAENTPQFSPYSYCGGNPINFGDYNGMDWYGYKDSIEINGVMTETYSIRYTEYTSQEELDKNNISGDYLGKRVVSIMGSYNEVLDDSKMIDGEKTIHATARVYINPEDETTPTEYIAFTMSSDYNKYGAIKDGNYNVTYRESPGGGKIPKHYEIEGPVDCIDDRNNSWYNGEKDAYSPTQKNNVFVHRTNTSGYAGDPVSKGCITH
jgi:RHS repeat-associated protein